MSDFSDLAQLLASLSADTAIDPAELSLQLQSFKDRFLHHLEYPGPNPGSKQQLESLLVKTKYGEQRLDAEPDKRLALQISTALHLDEVMCVEYLIQSQDERGLFTAESAAGVYLAERQAEAQCLMRLLSDVAQQVIAPQDTPRHPYLQVLHDFVVGLLAETKDGQPKSSKVLVGRLLEVLKDTSLEPHASSDLQQVQDEAGIPVSRATMLQLEKRIVVKSLLYALVIDQRVGPEQAALLMDALTTHLTKMKTDAPADPFAVEMGHLLLLAAVLAITPQEDRGTQERDELQELLRNSNLRNKIFPAGSRSPGTGIYAQPAQQTQQQPIPPQLLGPNSVLRLAWGVLSCMAGTTGPSQDEARKLLQEAPANATFTYLKQIFSSPLFLSDEEGYQDLVACCVYRLLGQALQADNKLDNILFKALLDRQMLAVKRIPGGGVAFSPLAHDDPAIKTDHLGTVLSLLAAVFKVTPALWLAQGAGYAEAESNRLIDQTVFRTITSDAMRASPEARVPFYELMTSLASEEYGVAQVIRQFTAMNRDASFEVLTFRKLFATIIEYVVRYNSAIEEMMRQGTAGGVPSLMLRGQEERLMNSHEADILVAGLHLLRQIIESGAMPDVRSFLEGLERDMAGLLSGYPLTEPLFQLMCHPVPNTVKAVLDEVLAAIAHRLPDTTGARLLDRLVACAAVTPAGPVVPGMPRLDLATQLNEIEARKEEYPETLAFLQLLNSLISAAMLKDSGKPAAHAQASMPSTPASSPAAGNGGIGLTHFTQFVVQNVLQHLWHRGYKYPVQQWEIATACLYHLEIMMAVAATSTAPPVSPGSDRQPPGWAIMHDLLSSGPTLQALLRVLSPGYEDLSRQTLQSPQTTDDVMGGTADASQATTIQQARQTAVLAAFRVLNKALQLDQSFATSASQLSPPIRYQTLDKLLQTGTTGRGGPSMALALVGAAGNGQLAASQLVSTLLLYVCYQEDENIQVEAVRLALELSARNPAIVEAIPSGDMSVNPRMTLRQGMAVALRQSLSNSNVCDHMEEAMTSLSDRSYGSMGLGLAGTSTTTPAIDTRAALILKLLLQNVDSPATPSLTHLLMGYDCEPAMNAVEDSMLLPRQEYSCLTIIEKFLVQGNCRLSVTKPQLYSAMLCVLWRLANHLPSSGPIVEHISPKNSPELWMYLRVVLLQPLPPSDKVWETAASLHQKSWIMRLLALLLLRLEHPESAQDLLSHLLLPTEMETTTAAATQSNGIAGSVLMSLLNSVVGLQLQEPVLGDLPPEVRRLQADMAVNDISIEALLIQPHIQAGAEIHTMSDTGDVLFDIPKLYTLLIQRYEQYVLRNGQAAGAANDAAVETIKSTLVYVQQYNAYTLLAGAQQKAAEGWMQATEIAFTRTYSQLSPVLEGVGTSPAEAVYNVLMASLQGAYSLLGGATTSNARPLAATLVNVARILLSKLQELSVVGISLGQPSDPLLHVRTLNRCHALFRLLLELLTRSQRAQEVRVQLYAALLQYLHFCRGSKLSTCAPVVLQAVLRSLRKGTAASPAPNTQTDDQDMDGLEVFIGDDDLTVAAAARLDASQQAIEGGNAVLINMHGPLLVQVVARDALDAGGPQLQQAVALHLLTVLAGASSETTPPTTANGLQAGTANTSFIAALYLHAVPQTLLQSIASTPPVLLANPSKSSRRGVTVAAAQLALLLALVQAGNNIKTRQLAAQKMFELQPVQYLTGCRAVDLEPEEPGRPTRLPGGLQGEDSVRQRLRRLLCPLLRLVLGLLATLPESSAVRQDARSFVAAHYRALDRVLREAASNTIGDWSPGEGELEQAELATSLLSRLVPVWDELGPVHAEGLRTALYRVAAVFCTLNCNTTSPIVRLLHMNGTAADSSKGMLPQNRSSLLSRAVRIASLRAALARFLRDTVAHTPPTAAAYSTDVVSHGGSGVPFRCIGNADQKELDPFTGRPTLFLIRNMAEQACLDAAGALEELEDLLSLLRMPDHHLDDRTCVQKLLDYGPAEGAAAAAAAGDDLQGSTAVLPAIARGLHARRKLTRHYLALAASQLDGLLGCSLFVLENSLAVIVLHFLRYLPRALSDGPSTAQSSALQGGGGGGGAEELLMAAAAASLHMPEAGAQGAPHLLGSRLDLAFLSGRLQETCTKAEELLNHARQLGLLSKGMGVSAGPMARHMERFHGVDLMIRTVKSYCEQL